MNIDTYNCFAAQNTLAQLQQSFVIHATCELILCGGLNPHVSVFEAAAWARIVAGAAATPLTLTVQQALIHMIYYIMIAVWLI